MVKCMKCMNNHIKKLHRRGTESKQKKKDMINFLLLWDCLWWTSRWFNWNGCGLTSFLKVNHRTHTHTHKYKLLVVPPAVSYRIRTCPWKDFKLVWKWMKPFHPWFQFSLVGDVLLGRGKRTCQVSQVMMLSSQSLYWMTCICCYDDDVALSQSQILLKPAKNTSSCDWEGVTLIPVCDQGTWWVWSQCVCASAASKPLWGPHV